MPYASLCKWCGDVRRSRKLTEEGKQGRHKMTKDQIERLDTVGFQWKTKNVVVEHIEEL